MSAIQEPWLINYLLEDSKQIDSNWFREVDLNAKVTKANKIASSFVVAVAEAVNYVAQGVLLGLSCNYLGEKMVFLVIGAVWCVKLIDSKPYNKEDTEKFDNRKSYIQYFQEKAELVACLPGKKQAYWLVKECIKSTIYKIIAAAIILKRPQSMLFVNYPCYIACVAIWLRTEKFLDFFEAKMHSFVHHRVKNQQLDLA